MGTGWETKVEAEMERAAVEMERALGTRNPNSHNRIGC